MNPLMPTAYAYTRYSLLRQERLVPTVDGEKSESLRVEALLDRCRQCYDQEFSTATWGDCFVDRAVTARIHFGFRPAAQELQSRLTSGDIIIIPKVDRAFRNLIDCSLTVQDWLKSGITVKFLDLPIDITTPVGEWFLSQMASMAQFERRLIGERTREALQSAKERGLKTGPDVGFGFQWKGNGVRASLIPDMRIWKPGTKGRKSFGWRDRSNCTRPAWHILLDIINLSGRGYHYSEITEWIAQHGDCLSTWKVQKAIEFYKNIAQRRHELGIQSLPDDIFSVANPIGVPAREGGWVRLRQDIYVTGGRIFKKGEVLYCCKMWDAFARLVDLETQPGARDGPQQIKYHWVDGVAPEQSPITRE